jgi:TRAP-type C4-dicarboxylate transport system permease small subunit
MNHVHDDVVEAPAGPDEPPLIRGLRALDRWMAKGEEFVLAILLVELICLAVYQAYKRNLAPPSPYWPDEIIRYSVFSIGMLGAALASHSARLMNIDLVVRLLPLRGRVIMRVFSTLFTLVVLYLLLRGGLFVRAVNIKLHEHGEIIRPATGILVLPIAAVLIGLHMAAHMVIDLYYLAAGKLPPDADEIHIH